VQNEPQTITLRPAKPEDAREAAGLIFQTGQEIFRYLFYPEKADTLEILSQLFQMDANDFSYRYAQVAEMKGQIGGLVIAVDKTELTVNYRKMGSKIIQAMGLSKTLKRLPRFILFDRIIPDVDSTTLYIKHLATLREFQNKGLATRLLEFCDQSARNRKLSNLVLDVEIENTAAKQFYEHNGFQEIRKIVSDTFLKKFGFAGLYRMVKALSEGPY
jgi:ribosomal protein S18 acetylase RimI-like enzyme